MDFEQLKSQLNTAKNIYNQAEKSRSEQIKAELAALNELLTYLMPALIQVDINGMKAVMIYEYEDSGKKTISPKVYFCEDGKIRYQVFKKEEYRSYKPTVVYEGSFAVVEAEEQFKHLDLSDVVGFLLESAEEIKKDAYEIEESKDLRESYLNNYRRVTKRLFK